ncbi:hypothetical protein M5689_015266 [Euphorbia peplus]|nr:hypothetical protein M5689_015266 [Euphorbia peplus]
MSFSSPPTSPHCFVIGITRNNAFGIIVRGEEKWSFYESFNIVGQFKPYSHLTICGDCCYAIGHRSKILVFDLKHKSTKFIGNPLYKDNSSVGFEAQFLVKDGTKLLSVMVPWEEQNILIEKITPLKREWSSVETLNNKMLFVSDTSSMLKLAPLKARSNKIYFPKIYNNDTFVPYCLATRKYISLFGESDYSKKSPWNSTAKIKQWSNCTWIETKPFAFACNQQTDW